MSSVSVDSGSGGSGSGTGFGPKGGSTALHFAAANGHTKVVSYLLSKGANPAVRDEYGSSPLDVSMARGHTQIGDLLMPHYPHTHNMGPSTPTTPLSAGGNTSIPGSATPTSATGKPLHPFSPQQQMYRFLGRRGSAPDVTTRSAPTLTTSSPSPSSSSPLSSSSSPSSKDKKPHQHGYIPHQPTRLGSSTGSNGSGGMMGSSVGSSGSGSGSEKNLKNALEYWDILLDP
ncbi:hypothetical protein HK102_010581, partial [Quaeritorhiza haematococci]